MQNIPSISIVVVLYNSIDELYNCINSITPIKEFISNIYFIDNSDLKIAKENYKIILDSFTDFNYKHYTNNIGSAAGFREGMLLSFNDNIEWTWLLDQDGTIENKDFSNLLYYLNNYKSSILCPKVIVDKTTNKTALRKIFTDKYGRNIDITSDVLAEIHLFGTHGTIIHRQVFEKIGFYDSKIFFVGWEDFDYSLRALKSGIKIYFLPNVACYHPDLSVKHSMNSFKFFKSDIKKKFPIIIEFNSIILNKNFEQPRFKKSIYGYSFIKSKYFNIINVLLNSLFSFIYQLMKLFSFLLTFKIDNFKNGLIALYYFCLGTIKGFIERSKFYK